MKYLKLFDSHGLTNRGIVDRCKEYRIENYTINNDNSIDVNGNVDLRGIGFWDEFNSKKLGDPNKWTLEEIPIKFRNVSGTFDIRYNKISTLQNCPKDVEEFYISDNILESLVGSPDEVTRFLGGYNNLTTLEGGPKICHGDYNVRDCKLKSLLGLPEKVSGYICFNRNPIHTLDGIPKSFDVNKTIFMGDTPIGKLCEVFLDPIVISTNNITLKKLEKFFKSLEYGYLKDNVISESRFILACDELGIENAPDEIDGYIFI